jgi:hypothetical protein
MIFRCRVWSTRLTEDAGTMRDRQRLGDQQPRAYRDIVTRHFAATLAASKSTTYRLRLAFHGAAIEYERTTLPLAAAADTPPTFLWLSLWESAPDASLLHRPAEIEHRID